METVPTDCHLEYLERFFDGELRADARKVLEEHTKRCSACRRVLRENRFLATILRVGVMNDVSKAYLGKSEAAILERCVGVRRRWQPWALRSPAWRGLVPAAIAISAVLFFFFGYPFGPASTQQAPSAVVQSLRAEVSSVMIFQTPRSRQTIVWFQEDLSGMGHTEEGNGVQGAGWLLRDGFGTVV